MSRRVLAFATRNAGVRQIETAGSQLHLQAMITTEEVKRWRVGRAGEKGGAERLLDGLHGGRLGSGQHLHGLMLLGRRLRQWHGAGRSHKMAVVCGLVTESQELLEGEMAGRRLRLGGGESDRGSGEGAIAQQLTHQQDQQAGGHGPGEDMAPRCHSRGGVDALEIKERADAADFGSGSSGMDIDDAPSSSRIATQVKQAQKYLAT